MQVFVARQPIFDRLKRAIAYELLFRSGTENFFAAVNGDKASQDVLSRSVHVFGFHALTGRKPAFVNVTRDLLLSGVLYLFPPTLLIVEVLETVEPDEEVIAACQELKRNGYLVALDDFVNRPDCESFVALADIIKVDFTAITGEERWQLAKRFAGTKVRLLAEKVETHEDFEGAMKAGYTYFQGFFFCKPEIVAGQDIPSHKLTYLRLLQEVSGGPLDFNRVETVLRSDVALSYKLLRYINSAAIGLRYPVTSVRQAIVLLGEKNFRRWLMLALASSVLEDKPSELLTVGVVRGWFCELACQHLRWQGLGVDPFLVGLLSVLDALLNRPLPELLDELPIAPEIRDALLGRPTLLGRLLQLALAYERADWERVAEWAAKVGLPEEEIPALYTSSIARADQLCQVFGASGDAPSSRAKVMP